MDRYEVGPKCQFNIVYFGRRVHIQANEKFVDELVKFIKSEQQFEKLWGSFACDLTELLDCNESVIYDEEEPTLSVVHDTFLINLSLDEADGLSNCVLNFASPASQKIADFPLNSFVAFGRKLRAVVEGEFTSPQQRPAPRQVREIIVERRVIR